MDELAQRLSVLPTSVVCDVSIKIGTRRVERVVMRGVRPLTLQSRAAGRARTQQVVCIRDTQRASRTANWDLHVGLAPGTQPGEFLVMAVAGVDLVASLGDLIASQAQARGATGIVVDGYIRDAAAIERMGMPVWSAGVTMMPQGYLDYSVQSINEPVTCAGVEVVPGDLIAADGDGVIVIPAAEAEAIIAAAEELHRKEERASHGIKGGGNLGTLYPRGSFDRPLRG